MKVIEKVETWFAIGLLVCFFLPWLSWLIISVSGYNIGSIAGAGSTALLNVVWLIPILSLVTIAMAAMGQNIRIIALITGVVSILVVILLFAWVASNSKELPGLGLGIGAYVTVLAAIGIILAALGIIKSPMSANTPSQ